MTAQSPGTWPMPTPSTPLNDKRRQPSLPSSDVQSDTPLPRSPEECQQCFFIPVITKALSSVGEACGLLAGNGVPCAQPCPVVVVSVETPKLFGMWTTALNCCFLHLVFCTSASTFDGCSHIYCCLLGLPRHQGLRRPH